jgi:nicotinate-nucleotide pyrophosphorylase (carboxylating)
MKSLKLPPRRAVLPLVRMALREDVGRGDRTAAALAPERGRMRARIVAKARGVVAGLPVAALVFRELDPRVRFHALVRDGATVRPAMPVAEVTGPPRTLLTGERTALNFLQRMSGIATAARALVDRVRGTRARVYDTRKTAPGFRLLDKYAVRAGGAENHRMGLDDAFLVKNNHFTTARAMRLDFAGAVRRARAAARGVPLEVEVRNLAEFRIALAGGADVILLDNFPPILIGRAVAEARRHPRRPRLEASGGIHERNIRAFARTGVDRISVGALTHSVRALDLALYVQEPGE